MFSILPESSAKKISEKKVNIIFTERALSSTIYFLRLLDALPNGDAVWILHETPLNFESAHKFF
jgi:hypothetical protein